MICEMSNQKVLSRLQEKGRSFYVLCFVVLFGFFVISELKQPFSFISLAQQLLLLKGLV